MASDDVQIEDVFCPAGEEHLHCRHWYDGEDCCSCQEAPVEVLDLTVLYINLGPHGASTVVRNNATKEIIEIPGGPLQVTYPR